MLTIIFSPKSFQRQQMVPFHQVLSTTTNGVFSPSPFSHNKIISFHQVLSKETIIFSLQVLSTTVRIFSLQVLPPSSAHEDRHSASPKYHDLHSPTQKIPAFSCACSTPPW